ncbi:MAG: sugar phosphate nucleotidyltransferase, partial [Thermodesulfovibrionales bacterium]|nr:sugar phosphate nucleotidyltransferase [Thermodesulfovibrionales bacterium]
DAIYQNIQLIESSSADLVAIFGGDHIYKMDISQMLIYHKMNKADITIASIEVSQDEARRFGILSVDEDFKVKTFVEKPQSPPIIPGRNTCFASMGNYIFSRKVLLEVLEEGKRHYADLDFGKHVIPMMLDSGKRVFAYNFFDNHVPSMTPQERGYWMDVGTIDSYFDANMDLISVSPRLNLYNYDWPILTNQGNLPPAKTVFDNDLRRGVNLDSLVCGGCITSGGTVRRSIIGPSSRVNSYCLVEDSIVFENVEIGRHSKIKKAIIDENVIIPEGTVIGYNPEEDKSRGFTVTDSGIVVVTKDNFK